MDLRKDTTIGGKRIATYDDFLKLEEIVGSGGGSGGWQPGEGEDASIYKLEIMSSSGTKAVNGVFNSTFSCKIYRFARDVTDIVLASGEYQFFWERHSGDSEYDKAQDIIWANNRTEGSVQEITSKDIVPGRPNNFVCSMYSVTSGNVVLSSI